MHNLCIMAHPKLQPSVFDRVARDLQDEQKCDTEQADIH